ncbi:MAG: CoA-binding protein [Bacteroidetes bacterium HGW-Bacteroidetes-21]|nr:MAG: CoA-binding protein [Bacteroidetes bacterium HGW-Bacteroidetes-21]
MNETVEIMVLGASSKQGRYSYLAVRRLIAKGYKVIAVGKTGGEIDGVPVLSSIPEDAHPQTVLMYLAPENQSEYLETLIKIKPWFVIFSPGTEFPEFEDELRKHGIQVMENCALIMMSLDKL